MKLHCYSAGPIEWWHGGIPTEHMEARIRMKDPAGYTQKLDLDAIWEEAQALGREMGWEGEIADAALFPLWGTVPDPEHSELGLWCAWKQPTNGTTFVCSTVDLTRLGDFFRAKAGLDTKTD